MEYKMKEYAALKRVSYQTIKMWVKKGLVKTIALPSGRVRIIDENLEVPS